MLLPKGFGGVITPFVELRAQRLDTKQNKQMMVGARLAHVISESD